MRDHAVLEGRRRLLKIIAATGGAMAASVVLPGKWLKPVVEMGVLPAHAQLSGLNITIDNLTINPSGNTAASQDVSSSRPPDFSGEFDWKSRCFIPEDGYLWVKSEDCGFHFKGTESGKGPWKTFLRKKKTSEEDFSGGAYFELWGCGPPSSDRITVWLEGCDWTSNKLTKKINWPGTPS